MQPQLRSDFKLVRELGKDPRSEDDIVEHYLLEKRLAARLQSASTEDRKHLYKTVYNELFSALPHHPQHHANYNDSGYIARQSALLRKLVRAGSVFVEIGAGDARLSMDMASHCKAVVAVDVTDVLFKPEVSPSNVTFSVTDGTHLDLPGDSVDFVYSNQLMEHLHPVDARVQLREIHRILKRGGTYLCITPNLTTGPHDVSQYFDRQATGFHLKEYSFGSLAGEMREAGFRSTTPILVRKGGFQRMPLRLASGLEVAVKAVETLTRRSYRANPKVRALLGITMLATK